MLKSLNYDTFSIFLLIALITILLFIYIIRFLVNKKIISSNKFTRSIYLDNDAFKEKWPVLKSRGVYRYILKNLLIYMITILVVNLIEFFIFKEVLSDRILGTTIATLIGVCIGCSFNWSRMEDRYHSLIKS